MLKQNLLNFLNSNIEIFKQKYYIASKTADPDAVHDMRVSLKRIRALHRMLNIENNSNFRLNKCFDPLKIVFKKAGPVRDFQVQELLLKHFKLNNMNIEESLVKKFIEKKISLINQFYQEHKSFDYLKTKRSFRIIEHYIKSIDDKILLNQLEIFEKNRKELLKKFSCPEKKTFNLHSARKMIKDMAYLMEMSLNIGPDANSKLAEFKEIGHILGDWHDRTIMLLFLDEIHQFDNDLIPESIDLLKINLNEQRKMLKDIYLERFQRF